jgi:predicted HTH transcriptional regulator
LEHDGEDEINVTENGTGVSGNVTENNTGSESTKDTNKQENAHSYINSNLVHGTGNGTGNGTGKSSAEYRREKMLHLMRMCPKITTEDLTHELNVSRRTLARDISYLKSQNILDRVGDDFTGSWIVKDL